MTATRRLAEAGAALIRRLPRRPSITVLTAGAIYVCAWLSYALTIRPAGVVAIWLPSGFMLALLVLLERRSWPAAALGAFLGNLAVDLQHGASLATGIAGSAANVFESIVAAWVLVWLTGPRITLSRLREVGALVVGAVIASNGFTALLGSLVLSHGSFATFWRGWFIWWTGDGMGMLVVAPVILTWVHLAMSDERIRWWLVVEAVCVFAVLAVVAHSLLAQDVGSGGILGGRPYLAFPLLLWSAIRFGPWGAATAVLILSCVATWQSAQSGSRPGEGGQAPLTQLLEIYSYLALATLTSLIPASILSEHTRTERSLRESEQRFRQMAEAIKEAFLVIDVATGRPLYASPTWAEIWGRPLAEAYQPGVYVESIHPDDRDAMLASLAAAARGEESASTFRVRRPDGSQRWVRRRLFPIRDGSGRVHRLAGVSEDITTLRQTEERFLQAQKMEAIGLLAGGVAHDFNNLLTVIISYSELLLGDLGSADPRRKDLEEIRKAALDAAGLTRQLLAFSRQQVLEPKVLDLNTIVSGAGNMLERLIGEDVRLVTVLAPDLGTVKADPGQVEQVIMNLAVNARDAMPEGGKITVETANADLDTTNTAERIPVSSGAYVLLSVSDTGVGMNEETQRHIFEPFFTTKEFGKGTGLGLATVYGIVKQSGGFIWVYSEVGHGTTFKIYLPRVDESAEVARQATTLSESARGNETVLLAEDAGPIRAVSHQILKRSGYTVLEAPDGNSALNEAAKHHGPIHLLITDVIMPEMSGRQLAERLKENRPELKVLFVSGYTDDAIVRHGILEPGIAFLQKPFSPELLARKVREVLDTSEPPV